MSDSVSACIIPKLLGNTGFSKTRSNHLSEKKGELRHTGLDSVSIEKSALQAVHLQLDSRSHGNDKY